MDEPATAPETPSPAPPSVQTGRRWYQYSLWVLFLATFVVALITLGVTTYVRSFMPRQRLVLVTVDCPAFTPSVADDTIAAPLRFYLYGSAERVTSISTAGRVEAYAQVSLAGNPPMPTAEITAAQNRWTAEFPSGVSPAKFTLLPIGSKIPKITPKLVDIFEVNIDRAALAGRGILISKFYEQLTKVTGTKPATPESVKQIQSATIKVEGHDIRVSELAKISIVKEPSHIVKSLP